MKIRLFISLTLSLLAAAQTASVAGTSTSVNTTSESTLNFTNLSYATVDQQVDEFSTELIAQTSSSNVVFDQTFNVAYSDPTVQAAVTQAASNLAVAGQSSFNGPTLTSNLDSVIGTSTNSIQAVTGVNVGVTVTTYIGPQTIYTGDNQSVPLTIVAGGQDIDTLVTSTNYIVQTNTITSTNLTTQIYTITGIPAPAVTNDVLYNVYDLGTLSGTNSQAMAINNVGQIVGEATLLGGAYHAAFWTNILTAPINLGDTNITLASDAYGINGSGSIAGLFSTADFSRHAAYWTNSLGPPVDLGTLESGTLSAAYSVNDSGQIVGYSTINSSGMEELGCFWTNSASPGVGLATLGGNNSAAMSINSSGQIVGTADTAVATHAAFWTNNSSPPVDLGTLGIGTNSEANSINNAGQIAGDSDVFAANNVTHAAFWTNLASAPFDLGLLPNGTSSTATCLNNKGQIVGLCGLATNSGLPLTAALWPSPNSPAVNLNTAIPTNSGWYLVGAYGINDSGVIVGTGVYTNSVHVIQLHAFALVPLNLPTNADVSLNASAVFVPTGSPETSNLVYTLTVSNAGPATATDVVISNQVPPDGVFISVTGGATPTNGVLLVNLGSLAAGATDAVQLVEGYVLGGDVTTNNLANAFTVYADQPDPDLANNYTNTVTPINAPVTFFTTSTRFEQTNLTANVKQTATNFTTELIAKLPNGTVAYEMTFSNVFTDPTVQAAVTTAAGDLSGDGDSSYTGPTETSFAKTFEDKTSVTVTNPVGTNITATVTAYVGPTNIFVGNGQTNLFTLPAGHSDIDTLVTYEVTNLLTTTLTSNYLNSAVYVMTGIVTQASADLSLSGSAIASGNDVEFSLTVSNAGPDAATGVVVSNQIPAHVMFVSATGGATPTNGLLLVNLGSLGVGATNLVQIVMQPTNSVFLTNTFRVFGGQTDPVPANNSVTLTGEANSITTSSSELTYETILASSTNQQATNYSTELIAKLPNGTVVYDQTFYVAYANATVQTAVTTAAGDLTGDGATGYTGPVQTSSLNTLVSTSSMTAFSTNVVSFTNVTTTYVGPVTVTNGNLGIYERFATNAPYTGPTGGSPTKVTVVPGGEDINTLTTVDLDIFQMTNNTVTNLDTSVYVMTGIVAAVTVDVALSMTAGPAPVDVGDPLTYSLMVTNNSTNTATGVVVSNTLPPGVVFNSVLASQGTATNHAGVVKYNVGSLPNRTAATLAIVVVPTAAGQLTNYATAYSAQTDSQPANNSATNMTTAVSVAITNLVLTVLSDITLNPQTGLFEQQIEVSNGGPATPSSVLVLISGLPQNATVYNASGSSNGVPYVQSMTPLGVGSNVIFTVEYYVPTRVAPVNLAFTVVAGPAVTPPVVTGTILSISQAVILDGGDVLVEFSATPGRIYAVQYSSDMVTWQTAVPAIKAPGTQVQWIDSGPPKTASSPAGQGARYYRVVLLN